MTGLGVGAVLFVWVVGALLGGNDSPSVRGAANVEAGATGTAPPTSGPASNPPSSGRIAIAPASRSASVSASASPTTTAKPATTAPKTTTPAKPTTTPPPTTCPDSVLRVTVTSDRPSYPVGAHPQLTLHIGNAGKVACLRDVSHQLRSIEITVAGSKTVLWASNDCYALNTHEIRTLPPGGSLSYGVTWAGRTAAPGCPAARTTVPAGKYQIVGKLGNLTGPPATITLT